MRNLLSFHKVLPYEWKPGVNTTAWYKLETDANDYSGNNRNASGANVTYGTSGDLKYAIFNGSSSYLLANNGLSSGDYTVSVWINISSLGTEAILITNGSGNNMQPVYLTPNGAVYQGYRIGSSSSYTTPNGTVGINTWYNIVSVREGSTAKIYINGQLIGSGSVTTNTYTDQRSIGAQKYYNQHWFNGKMSNLIIENKARTIEDVAKYYNRSKANYPKTSNYRYIKWYISAIRSNDGYTQMSEFEICDSNGTKMSRPSGTTITASKGGNSGETIDKLIDGSTNTKYCTNNNPPIEIIVDLGAGIDFSTYNKYKRYTANDADSRDPKSWTISLSNDGSTWTEVSNVSNATITTSRKTLAGTWDITL